MRVIPTYKLLNGIDIPVIGQGTYPMKGKILKNAILESLRNGCTLIDTAHSYPNEGDIGDALHSIFKTKEYTRKEIFLTSKIGDKLDHGMPMGYYFYNSDSCPDKNHKKIVKKQVEESLKKLKTDYIDLLMIHWPYNDCLEEIWEMMETIYKEGLVRAIGVSNHKVRHLKRILSSCDIIPMVNQIYFSPLNLQEEIYNFCRDYNIIMEAYSPLMFLRKKNLISISPQIQEICNKYNKSIDQVILKWNLEKKVIPIPKAASVTHIKQNYDIFDFNLTSEEIKVIDSFNENYQGLPESIYCPGY